MNAPAPGEFVCKRCEAQKPSSEEVVTRSRTRICRECWGRTVQIGIRGAATPPGVCTRCNVNPASQSRTARGTRRGWCRPCRNAYASAHRRPYSSMTEAQRTKAIARSKAKMALRRGKIVRQPCDGCGEPKSQMHHDDYAQPLLVRWLCATCHRAHHATMKHLIPRGTDNREGRINDA